MNDFVFGGVCAFGCVICSSRFFDLFLFCCFGSVFLICFHTFWFFSQCVFVSSCVHVSVLFSPQHQVMCFVSHLVCVFTPHGNSLDIKWATEFLFLPEICRECGVKVVSPWVPE